MNDKITLAFFSDSRPIDNTPPNRPIDPSHLNKRSQHVINRYYETKDPYFAGELVLQQKTRARQILKNEIGIVEKIQEILDVDLIIATVMLIGLDYLGKVKFSDGGGGKVFRTINQRI